MNEDSWVLVDTETDGFSTPIHAVEIAAQLFHGTKPVGSAFHAYLNHRIPIPGAAVAIHGYTSDFLEAHGVDPVAAYRAFWNYVGGNPVAAHWARFDWDRVLVPESNRLGIPINGRLGYCTWALARRALPEHPTWRLDYLRSAHGLTRGRAHTAIGDIETTEELVLRIILPRLHSLGMTDVADLAYFSRQPIAVCHLLLQGETPESALIKLAAAKVSAERNRRLAEQVEFRSINVMHVIRDLGLSEEHPEIKFAGQKFLFTGTLESANRKQAQQWVKERGGNVGLKSVTQDLDYLVIGDADWDEVFSSSKLTSAVARRLRGSPRPHIVREQDFLAAISAEDRCP